jgi:hypothetical protein
MDWSRMSQYTVMGASSNLVKCRSNRVKYTVRVEQHWITKVGKGPRMNSYLCVDLLRYWGMGGLIEPPSRNLSSSVYKLVSFLSTLHFTDTRPLFRGLFYEFDGFRNTEYRVLFVPVFIVCLQDLRFWHERLWRFLSLLTCFSEIDFWASVS